MNENYKVIRHEFREKEMILKRGQSKDNSPLQEASFHYKNTSSGKANRQSGKGMIHRITNTQYK